MCMKRGVYAKAELCSSFSSAPPPTDNGVIRCPVIKLLFSKKGNINF